MLKLIKKYLSIYWAFFKASLIADLEYRFNFIVRVVNDFLWYASQIFTFEMIYRHTQKIGDWGIEQTRVFLGVLFVVDAFYMLFVHENLDAFPERVSRGDLDFLILKPVNSQFMVSCQKFVTPAFVNLLMGIAWLTWSLHQLEYSFFGLMIFIMIIPSAVLIIYSLRFFFAATSVIFVKSENIQFLWFALYRVGIRPDTIYEPIFRFFILFIIPIGLIASVPTRVLFEEKSSLIMVWAIVAGPIFLFLSNIFWKFSLRRYASASS